MPAGNFNYSFCRPVVVFPVSYCGQTLGTENKSAIYRVVELWDGAFAVVLYLRMPGLIVFLNLIQLTFGLVILSRTNLYLISKTERK